MQLLLATMRWRGRHACLAAATVELARADMREGTTRFADEPEVFAVRNFTIATPAGHLRVRHYVPDGSRTRPLVVFLHGGGFALGDLDTHDLPCRLLCRSAGAHILSVDYRLAPEHPFPAAIEDSRAALRWASEHAEELGADPTRLAIAGDSAGGALSAVIARECADGNGPALRAQLLIYPCTDMLEEHPSRQRFGDGLLLTATDIAWFNSMYLRDVERGDPRVSPLRAATLSSSPPAIVVTAGFDPLRDEGEAYATALRQAGNQVVSWREAGLLHGFIHVAGVSRHCREVVKRMGSELAALL
jgi:acetyl esterase